MKILDVRTKREFDQGHINGALWFELGRILGGEMPNVPKDVETVLYCRSGVRADVAMRVLRENGFMRALNGGGMAAMVARGYEVVH